MDRIRLTSGRSEHRVELGELVLPALVQTADSSALVVSFHGALDRSRYRIPRFEWLRTLSALGGNVLCLADPGLVLDPAIELTWYLGTRSLDLPPRLAEVVEEVRGQLGCTTTVLWGSSGGGYAALQTAAFLPGVTAMVANPQIDLRRYRPWSRDRAFRLLFGEEAPPAERVSVIERYRATDLRPDRVRYLTNSGDVHHVTEHATPFFAYAAATGLPVERVDLDDGPGHIRPGVEVIVEHLGAALASPRAAVEPNRGDIPPAE